MQRVRFLARLNDERIRAEILKQKASLDELEASLASARSDAVRARSVASGVITAQTIEQRETLVKTTEASWRLHRRSCSKSKRGNGRR